MDVLFELQDAIAKEWDEMADTGKIYMDKGEVLLGICKNKTKVGLHSVPISKVFPNVSDVLVGFYVGESAKQFKNEMKVSIGNNVVLEDLVIRGRKKFIDQPIPLIALQQSSMTITVCDTIFADDVYVICASCDNPYRVALVKNKFAFGKLVYEDGRVAEMESTDVPKLCVNPKTPVFGGVNYGESKFDEDNNIYNPNIDLYTQLQSQGYVV